MGDTNNGRPPSPAFDEPILPPVVERLREDARNTAPQTRARYEYQDECIALTLLDHLGTDLAGVLVEHSTDLILLPTDGPPELVSIKHREPHHSADAGWTWSALKADRVLSDLHAVWTESDRTCTTAFLSNAGLSGPAQHLWKACHHRDEDSTRKAVDRLSRDLGIDPAAAREFLDSLSLPRHPLPRRNEISDVGIRRTAAYLEANGRDSRFAAECYEALVHRIRAAGTDVPESRSARRRRIAATVRGSAEDAAAATTTNRYLGADEVRAVLLHRADVLGSPAPPGYDPSRWMPDPLFTGREEELRTLSELLRPGSPDPVAPVVVHGISGSGKTSLALQFAALRSDGALAPFVIDGSTRASVMAGLEHLAHEAGALRSGVDGLRGPVAVRLPGTSATLLIIDGVTDATVLRGLVPRLDACRVIITSTVARLDDGYHHLALGVWSRAESKEFLARNLTDVREADAESLAGALGDHPLALAQAVNYCHTVGIGVPDYLARLDRDAVAVLAMGQVSGHPVPVSRTMRLACDAVRRSDRTAMHLLDLMAYLGSEALPAALLDSSPVRPFVTMTRSTTSEYRSRFLRRRKTDTVLEWGGVIDDETGSSARVELSDPVLRDAAVATLASYGLLTTEQGHISVHSLVQRLVRAGHPDGRTWVETAVGLCVGILHDDDRRQHQSFHSVVGHAQTVLRHALAAGFRGPAVVTLAARLSQQLVNLGDEHEALVLARQAYEMTDSAHRHGLVGPRPLFDARIGCSHALALTGDADGAVAEIEAAVTLARASGQVSAVSHAYAHLGRLAHDFARTDLAETALAHLPDPRQPDPAYHAAPQEIRLFATHVRTRLLQQLGRIEEAQELNAWAIRQAEVEEPTIGSGWGMAFHTDASLMARTTNDADTRAEHSHQVLQILAGQHPDRRDRLYVESLLSAADAELDRVRPENAAPLLSTAEEIVLDRFGERSDLHTSLLAVRGRCRMLAAGTDVAALEEARNDLSQAVARLRETTAAVRTELPSALINLSRTLTWLGDESAALAAASEALRLDEEWYGPDHPETEIDRQVLAQIPLEARLQRLIRTGGNGPLVVVPDWLRPHLEQLVGQGTERPDGEARGERASGG